MLTRRQALVGAILSSGVGNAAAQSNSSGQPSVPTRQEAFQRGIQAIVEKRALRRVWFRAESEGHTLADFGLGGARADAQVPIASISKSITAIGIALLIQDGKLTLQSKVSDLLAGLYAKNQRVMPSSLRDVTIARLLSHTAGLQPNRLTDPLNGIDSFRVLRMLNDNATAFDFLVASDTDRSSGQTNFVYSNISYLMLGLVIEAVSQEKYEVFCKRRVFAPVGITRPTLLSGKIRSIGAYIGWALTRQETIRLWRSVFNPERPSILTRQTLQSTLFARLGASPPRIPDARYSLGVFIRSNSDNSAYRMWHNGVHNSFYSFLEDTRPGPVWMVQTVPLPVLGEGARDMHAEIRSLVDRLSRA